MTPEMKAFSQFRQDIISKLKKEQPNQVRDLLDPPERGSGPVISYFDLLPGCIASIKSSPGA